MGASGSWRYSMKPGIRFKGDKKSSGATVCPVTDLVSGTRIVCQCGGGRKPEDAGRAECDGDLQVACELSLQRRRAAIGVGCCWHDRLLYRQTAHNVERRIEPAAERFERIGRNRLTVCS